MTLRRRLPSAPEIVTLATNDERDRVAMVIMQLEMALALARLKGLTQLVAHLEAAIDEAKSMQARLLN